MITVVDYHKGNLQSVERGLAAQGAAVQVTDDAAVIARASAVVLPGVGAFGDAAATMARLGQMDAVREAVDRGAAFLGICLGMHLMFAEGEEGAPDGGPTPQGLGLIPGVVRRLPDHDADGAFYKIPHVGWNLVEWVKPESSRLLGSVSEVTASASDSPEGTRKRTAVRDEALEGEDGVLAGTAASRVPAASKSGGTEYFYFTHSYAAPESPATIGLTTHSVTFPSAVQASDRVFGVQFHPEKSSDAGAQLLRNFVTLAKES